MFALLIFMPNFATVVTVTTVSKEKNKSNEILRQGE